MRLTDLRGILQYIPQFREKTFILAIDGAIVTDENFATLLLDVAVLWSLNIRVVLVHGASAQIKALAEEQRHHDALTCEIGLEVLIFLALVADITINLVV